MFGSRSGAWIDHPARPSAFLEFSVAPGSALETAPCCMVTREDSTLLAIPDRHHRLAPPNARSGAAEA